MISVLAVVALLVAIPALFGISFLALVSGCKAVLSACMDEPLLTLPMGFVALAVTLAAARWAIIAANSRKRRRG